MPLLTRTFPDRLPFRVFEVTVPSAETCEPGSIRARRVTDKVAS
jgi:hypothetical protein